MGVDGPGLVGEHLLWIVKFLATNPSYLGTKAKLLILSLKNFVYFKKCVDDAIVREFFFIKINLWHGMLYLPIYVSMIKLIDVLVEPDFTPVFLLATPQATPTHIFNVHFSTC